jgi:3-keto-5-aminohexanoate cleavage enzyme
LEEGNMEKLIITAAITGGVHGKAANPNLPEQPEEQIHQAIDAWNAGAAIVHIHARDKTGRSTQDPEIYKKVKEGIRARGCDIVIQFSTGGGIGMTPAERLQSVDAEPEMASLNMGLTNYPLPNGEFSLFSNNPKEIVWYVEEMKKRNIKPEMEVYAPHMLREVNMLIQKGLLEKPYYVNFVMGLPAQGAIEATRKNLFFMIDQLPPDTLFNVCALGRTQTSMVTYAMLEGGMARVGLEDNIYYGHGELAKSNAQLVERAVRIANELQRPIASPAEARRILGLK